MRRQSVVVAASMLLACGPMTAEDVVSAQGERADSAALASDEMFATMENPNCRKVAGVQWCTNPAFVPSVNTGCASLCSSIGMTVMSNQDRWFKKQNTERECARIAEAFGFTLPIYLRSYTYACISYDDYSGFKCSTYPGCPAKLAEGTGDPSPHLICPCTVSAVVPVATVTVTLATSRLYVGQVTQASGVLSDARGNVLTGRTVTWTSSDPSVATVDSSGVVHAVGAGMASISATSEGESGSATLTVQRGVVTGIDDIQRFLEECPTNDPAYALISREFEVLVDGQPSEPPTNCSAPISTLPIDQVSDELIAAQALRTAYYMSMGTEGVLPWTALSLYDWMTSTVSGVNIKTAPGQLYCCDYINGKLYVSSSRQDEFNRDFKRAWRGIGITVSYLAHEIRHADSGPGHVTGCPLFPLPSDPAGCDATYDVSNLGSYGVAYWLHSSWATGLLNVGIGCSPPATALEYVQWDAAAANGLRVRFVTDAPPIVTPTEPYGGPCVSSP